MFDDIEVSDSIAEVLRDHCDSLALHNHLSGRADCAAPIWARSVELGWLGLALPESVGGLGFGARGARLLHYELGRFGAPGPFIATTCGLATLAEHDNPVVVDIISRVLAGEATLAIPSAVGFPGQELPRLRLLGDASASVALAPATDSSDLAVVELDPGQVKEFRTWDGTRQVLDVQSGLKEPLLVLPGARRTLEKSMALALAADSAGLARGIADRTIEFMKEREQFGKKIGSFQALKHRAANLRARSMFADNAVLQASEACDADLPAAFMWALLAKAEACDVAAFVSGDCVQLFGGVGFTVEYDPHIFAKRARLNEQLLMPGHGLRDWAAMELRDGTSRSVEMMELVE